MGKGYTDNSRKCRKIKEFSIESNLLGHVAGEDTGGQRVELPVIGKRNTSINFLQRALPVATVLIPAAAPATAKAHESEKEGTQGWLPTP